MLQLFPYDGDECEEVTKLDNTTYKNPSWRKKSARLVPLLQKRIAYDSVLIVAACPGTKHQLDLHNLQAKL